MNILSEERVSFKEIEKVFFEKCCDNARKATAELLVTMDEELHKNRDKKKLRDKGVRKTTIKTVYGEVEYERHVYLTKNETGKDITIYLLDQELGMDTIGHISTNLAEQIALAAVDVPFRSVAKIVSNMTGQPISHSGVWNVVQRLGEKLESEEKQLIQEFQTEQPRGKKSAQVLFEEMDGVWLKQQGPGGAKRPKMEVKVSTMYEGWKTNTGKRSTLAEKTVFASIDSSDVFLEAREAKIQSIYNPENIGLRILNGDGGSWIRDEYDAETIQQLDRFHVVKEIRTKISHAGMKERLLKLLRENKIVELLAETEIYLDSISTAEGTTEEQEAKELLRYLRNNASHLIRYNKRNISVPKAPDGVEYKNMGVQENENCTLITMRMKGKRKRWAQKSANNMIRLLYYRENKELTDAIERNTDGEIRIKPLKNSEVRPLSAGQILASEKPNKNKYFDIFNVHLPVLDSSNIQSAKLFKQIIFPKN